MLDGHVSWEKEINALLTWRRGPRDPRLPFARQSTNRTRMQASQGSGPSPQSIVQDELSPVLHEEQELIYQGDPWFCNGDLGRHSREADDRASLLH